VAHDLARVRADFDEIAAFGTSGGDRYDEFLLSLIPSDAIDILEMGSGLGRLCAKLATAERRVLGIDLSPVMIERARAECPSPQVRFVNDDFLVHRFDVQQFDCIVTAAALHHVPFAAGVERMTELLRPGGRLIIHDMRRDESFVDTLRASVTLAHHMLVRFLRTGRPRPQPHVRAAWIRHGHDEHYLSFAEAKQAAQQLLPGSQVHYHSMWRYTIVWNKP
jgi:SAM-dependent methyltransferase